MARYELAIFDFDGTIADTAPAIVACMQSTFESFGLNPPPEEAVRDCIGLDLKECVRRLHPGEPSPGVEEWVRAYRAGYMEISLKKTVLFPGAAEAIERLGRAGVELAVISNKGEAILRKTLDRLGLAGSFGLICGDAPGRAKKPDPSLYEREAAALFKNPDPGKILVVGDTSTDLRFAENIGAHACWASFGYGDEKRCLTFFPRYKINHFSELGEIVIQGEG